MKQFTWRVNNPSWTTVLGCCLAALLILFIGVILSTAIIMGFWNWVLVPVFGIEEIGWGQAFLVALFINLVGSAFKNFTSRD